MPSPFEVNQGVGSPYMGGGGNPMEWMNQLNTFQQGLMQNRQTQMSWAANQALGEILAHSNSLEEGIAAAQKNPQIMGNATEGMRNLAAFRNLEVGTAQQKQAMAHTAETMTTEALPYVFQGALNGLNDLPNWHLNVEQRLTSLPPEVQASIGPQVKAWIDAGQRKIAGLQGPAADAAMKTFLAGTYTTAHGDPAQLESMIGPPPTLQPDQTIYKPFGAVQGAGVQPGTTLQGPGAPPPTIIQGQAGTNPITNTPYDISDAGKIAFIRNHSTPDDQPMRDRLGQMHLPPRLEGQDKTETENFEGKEFAAYQSGLDSKAQLATMKSAAMDAAARGGWFTSGFAGDLRKDIGNAIGTAGRIFGMDVDPDVIAGTADMETESKSSLLLANSVENLYQGEGKKALGLFIQASHAVPGLENTPLGMIMLSDSLEGMANYSIAKRAYKVKWRDQPSTQGVMLGAEDTFNAQSNPMQFINKAYADSGVVLDPTGKLHFKSVQQLQRAWNAGLFGSTNPDDAKAWDVYKQFRNDLEKNK